MEYLRSLNSQYGTRTRDSDSACALLDSSSNHGSELSDEYSEPKTLENRPTITWRISPTFFISFNLPEIQRRSEPFFHFLLPSWLRTRSNKIPRKLYSTSWLDGLRGVAALFVVIHHYAYTFTATSMQGWHTGEDGSHNWFFLIPVVRVVHAGRFMVAIFFVISGYVLSYRSLKLAREGKPIELLDSLASSVFRRWLRLHLPVITSTFIAFLMARANAWSNMPEGWEHSPTGSYVATQATALPIRQGTFVEQFWDWFRDAQQLCDPFRYGNVTVSAYNINILWTIPIEWMGSMLVFVTILGLARMRTWVKLSVLSYIFYWCHHTARWEPATFIAGVLLAELSFIRTKYSTSSSPSLGNIPSKNLKFSKYLDITGKLFWVTALLFGLYAGSHPPDSASTTPGYQTLMSLIPSQYAHNGEFFWPAISGVIVVFALENIPWLHWIFISPFAQYLGDISFSLYMLHTMVMCTLGTWLGPRAMNFTGGWNTGLTGFVAGMALVLAITGPVTFWVSDVFSRGVDERCVRFARWVSVKCFAQTP